MVPSDLILLEKLLYKYHILLIYWNQHFLENAEEHIFL